MNKIYQIIISILSITFIAVIGFLIYKNFAHKKIVFIADNATVTRKITPFIMSNVDTGTQYKTLKQDIERLEVDLEQNDSVYTLEQKLRKRSFIYQMSVSRESLDINSINKKGIALDALNGLYNDYKDIPANNMFLRANHAFILSFIISNVSDSSITRESLCGQTTEYKLVESKYANAGLAEKMFLVDFLAKNSLTKDKLSIAILIANISNILGNTGESGGDINDADKKVLIATLNNLVQQYGVANPTRLNGLKIWKDVNPARYYADGLATLSRYDNTVTNESVINSFESAKQIIKNSISGPEDNIYMSEMFTNASYMSYLYSINKIKDNENKGKLLSDKTLTLMRDMESIEIRFKDNKEMLNVLNSYVASIGDEKNKNNIVKNNLLEIVEQDKLFKAFLVRHGLKV